LSQKSSLFSIVASKILISQGSHGSVAIHLMCVVGSLVLVLLQIYLLKFSPNTESEINLKGVGLQKLCQFFWKPRI